MWSFVGETDIIGYSTYSRIAGSVHLTTKSRRIVCSYFTIKELVLRLSKTFRGNRNIERFFLGNSTLKPNYGNSDTPLLPYDAVGLLEYRRGSPRTSSRALRVYFAVGLRLVGAVHPRIISFSDEGVLMVAIPHMM